MWFCSVYNPEVRPKLFALPYSSVCRDRDWIDVWPLGPPSMRTISCCVEADCTSSFFFRVPLNLLQNLTYYLCHMYCQLKYRGNDVAPRGSTLYWSPTRTLPQRTILVVDSTPEVLRLTRRDTSTHSRVRCPQGLSFPTLLLNRTQKEERTVGLAPVHRGGQEPDNNRVTKGVRSRLPSRTLRQRYYCTRLRSIV